MRQNTLHELGEFSFVHLIRRIATAGRRGMRPLVGIGDDAFVSAPRRARNRASLVISTDAFVSGIHFSPSYMSWRAIGAKAVAAAASDLAAMGAVRPRYLFASCALPRTFPVADARELVQGMHRMAQRCDLVLAGGDTVGSPKEVFLSMTVVGEAGPDGIISRSGARVGDVIYSSGPLGCAALGLELLRDPARRARLDKALARRLMRAHTQPFPQFRCGSWLAKNRCATALMDSSDGLAVSLAEIAHASGVGCDVDIAPLVQERDVATACQTLAYDPIAYCATGGEDFELIFTAPAGARRRIENTFRRAKYLGNVVARTRGVRFFVGAQRVYPRNTFVHF